MSKQEKGKEVNVCKVHTYATEEKNYSQTYLLNAVATFYNQCLI